MKITRLFVAFAALLCLATTTPAAPSGKKGLVPVLLTLPPGCDAELARDAGSRVVTALLTEFVGQRDITPKRFAVVPLFVDIDGSYFTDQVRDQFTTLGKPAGFELYTRMDDEWNQVLKEIEMGQVVGDTMDPKTIQTFGRIQGVQGIITGKVWSVTKDGDDTKVRMSLRAFEVETGRQLWGKEVAEIAHSNPSAMQQLTRLTDSPHAKTYGWIALGAFVGLFILFRIVKAFGAAARPR